MKYVCQYCENVVIRPPSQAAKFCCREHRLLFDKKQIELRRHKFCKNCSKAYYDDTKRIVGTTCSKDCASQLMSATRNKNGSYKQSDEQKEKISISVRKTYESQELREKISISVKEAYENDPTIIDRIQLSVSKSKLISTNKRLTNHSKGKSGLRSDLNQFFRSTWEANYARVLNHLNIKWEYEPQKFQLTDKINYTPDFKLDEKLFIEVKGWMTEYCKLKISLFKECYPEFKLIVVEHDVYKELVSQYKYKIPFWES